MTKYFVKKMKFYLVKTKIIEIKQSYMKQQTTAY